VARTHIALSLASLWFTGLAQGVPVVRVGLVTMGNPGEFTITASEAFGAYESVSNEAVGTWGAAELVKVRADGDWVRIGSKLYASIYFSGDGSKLKLFGPVATRKYRGWLHFSARAGKLTAVNEVGLETYLMGVVPCEMGPASPPEALKAQAVAARTYTLRRIGAFAAQGYDVDDTTRCHTYKGADVEDPRSNEAIRLTSGQILVYNGRPIEAFYATVSGGITASGSEVFKSAEPYLVSIRDVDETGRPYAADNKYFTWTKEVTAEELLAAIAPLGLQGKEVTEFAVGGRTESGRVSFVKVVSDGGEIAIPAGDLRKALGNDALRSTLFEISKTSAGWRLDGKGWGHGVGMCQAGAIGRAKAGQRYEDILRAYYSGVELLTVRGSALDLATRGGSRVDRLKFSPIAR
jgi:stage II sporulation protein D